MSGCSCCAGWHWLTSCFGGCSSCASSDAASSSAALGIVFDVLGALPQEIQDDWILVRTQRLRNQQIVLIQEGVVAFPPRIICPSVEEDQDVWRYVESKFSGTVGSLEKIQEIYNDKIEKIRSEFVEIYRMRNLRNMPNENEAGGEIRMSEGCERALVKSDRRLPMKMGELRELKKWVEEQQEITEEVEPREATREEMERPSA